MSANLATYIALPGTTAEAFRHWHDLLGGELEITTYGDQPSMEGMPFDPDPNAVAHAVLELPGGTIAGGDAIMPGEDYPVRDTAYSLLYTLDNPDEARKIIAAFIEAGGSANMPFELAPWGDWYGQVFDRFGVMWSVSVPASS